ncbi:MAG: serine/threonine-protein kinase [Phycisphaerales bacterium]
MNSESSGDRRSSSAGDEDGGRSSASSIESAAQVRRIFDVVMDLPTAQRGRAVEALTEGRPTQRDELLRLLEQDRRVRLEEATRAGPWPSASGDPADGAAASSSQDAMLLAAPAPHSIGGYRILEEIGRGGFGVVYRASTTTGVRQVVALKLLRTTVDSPNAIRRFRREAEILRRLHHPNIAGFFDAGVADGRPYVVMEHVEGIDIVEHCDRNRLSIDDRLALFGSVCEAVKHAHEQLVVHRDLKPANILVASDGAPKLVDFGIATFILDELQADTKLVTVGAERAMTPDYASPEQLRGSHLNAVTIDVYALGVILYELLSGHRPHRFDHRAALEQFAESIEHETPVAPSDRITTTEEVLEAAPRADSATTRRRITPEHVAEVRSTRIERLRRRLAGDLDLIVLKAIRAEPLRRYPSVEALMDDIRRHRAGEPVRAAPDSVVYRARKFVRRHRVGLASLAAVAVATTVAMILALQSLRAQAKVARAEAERATVEARADRAEADVASARADAASARADAASALADAAVADARAEAKRREELERLTSLLVAEAATSGGTVKARLAMTRVIERFLDWMVAQEDVPTGLRVDHARSGSALLEVVAHTFDAMGSADPEQIASIIARSEEFVTRWGDLGSQGAASASEALTAQSLMRNNLARLHRSLAFNGPSKEESGRAALDQAKQAVALAREAIAAAAMDGVDAESSREAHAALLEALATQSDIAYRFAHRAIAMDQAWTTYETAIVALIDQLDRAESTSIVDVGDQATVDLAAAAARAAARVGKRYEDLQYPQLAKMHYVEALRLGDVVVAAASTIAPAIARRAAVAHKDQLLWASRIERELGERDASSRHLDEFELAITALRSPDPDVEKDLGDGATLHEWRAQAAWDAADLATAAAEYQQAEEAVGAAIQVASSGNSQLLARRATFATSVAQALDQAGRCDECVAAAKTAWERWAQLRNATKDQRDLMNWLGQWVK